MGENNGRRERRERVISCVDDKLLTFGNWMSKIMKEDDGDFKIGIVGRPRSGKSTLAIELGFIVYPDYSIKENVIFSTPQLGRSIYRSKMEAFNVDEAILNAFARDSMTRMNKWLSKLMNVCAERNHLITFSVPRITSLDKEVLDKIDYMIYVIRHDSHKGIERGKYVIYDWTHYNPFRETEYPEKQWMGHFKKLPGAVYREYKDLKFENAVKELGIEDEENLFSKMPKIEIAKAIILDTKRFPYITRADMAKIFGNGVYALNWEKLRPDTT